ncbi:MAG TPA: orotate phosphoribosyltransferase [Caulobacteraceae bacterium]|nr:orotate phosphoribosyltransferase [Caulobacteraceae bacterium]
MSLATDPALAKDVVAAARLTGRFVLRSGQVADTYFDKYRFEADPALLRRIAGRMVALLPPEAELLAGLELGGVPIATAMALESGLPAAFVRKEAKTYGTCRAVEGADVKGRRLVMVEDVISTGGAIAQAAEHLAAEGAVIVAVVCAIWRGPGAPALSFLPGVPVRAAFTQDELT